MWGYITPQKRIGQLKAPLCWQVSLRPPQVKSSACHNVHVIFISCRMFSILCSLTECTQEQYILVHQCLMHWLSGGSVGPLRWEHKANTQVLSFLQMLMFQMVTMPIETDSIILHCAIWFRWLSELSISQQSTESCWPCSCWSGAGSPPHHLRAIRSGKPVEGEAQAATAHTPSSPNPTTNPELRATAAQP